MIDAFNTFNTNISLVRGDTLAFGIELYDENDEPLEVTVSHAYFSVKKDYNNSQYAFQKSLGNGIHYVSPGVYTVRIAPEDTVNLEPGTYYYDLQIALTSDVFTVLRGSFTLEYDVTRE